MIKTLRGLSVLDDIDLKIIELMADLDMSIPKVASMLHFNVSSVRCRVQKIRRITGLDPKCFYDLVRLIEIINGNGMEDAFNA